MSAPILTLLLVAATAEGATPALAPPAPEIAANCGAMYSAGPARNWCVRKAAEAEAISRRHKTEIDAAAAGSQPQADALAQHRAQAEELRVQVKREAVAKELGELGITDLADPSEAEIARRAAAAAETKRRIAAAEETQHTPEAMQFSLSAQICDRQAERAEALAAIKKERRYSKIGGVVHLGRLGELQDAVASADDDIAESRGELRELGKPALSCKYVAAHRE